MTDDIPDDLVRLQREMSDSYDRDQPHKQHRTTYPKDENVLQDDMTTRQRRRASRNTTLDRASNQNTSSSPNKRASRYPLDNPQNTTKPLLQEVAEDCGTFASSFLRIARVLYPIWKWFVFYYCMWLAVSYLAVYTYSLAMSSASAVLCPMPFVGSRLPLCADPEGRVPNAVQMATSQDELTDVMNNVGQSFDLARDMVGHEFAVRDLKIRVAASSLKRKEELARELESLIRYTKRTSKDLSRFTAKVGKSIDAVKIFDDYAVDALQEIARQRDETPTLPGRALSAIAPLAAWNLGAGRSEDEIKDLFISTATRISGKVKLLLDDSFELSHNLDAIQETLDLIKEIAFDELGDLPRKDVMSGLWDRLIRPDDHAQLKARTGLLTDMATFYEKSSNMMEETTAALNRIEAELSEFRDDYATPGLILKDYPLEITINLLRTSSQRLEAGKSRLESVEEGRRSQWPQVDPPQGGGAKMVSASRV